MGALHVQPSMVAKLGSGTISRNATLASPTPTVTAGNRCQNGALASYAQRAGSMVHGRVGHTSR